MSFKVIEKFILGKSRDISKCEDRIVVTDHFACLIDGATSKSDIDFDSKTQGVIAGELIEKVVRSMPTISHSLLLFLKSISNFTLSTPESA